MRVLTKSIRLLKLAMQELILPCPMLADTGEAARMESKAQLSTLDRSARNSAARLCKQAWLLLKALLVRRA